MATTVDSLSEVLVISDSDNKSCNCTIHDLKTASMITTFKEGNSVRNGLTYICEDYLISAFKDQPYAKIWTLSKNYHEDCKMLMPGVVSCLAVSNCGMYCIAGIENSVYVWEVTTGSLLSSFQYHSQKVSCLKFSSDGSHFISGGKDGMVLVWLLFEVVAAHDSSDNLRPRFTWMDHAAEVTDIFVGNLSIYARVVTASRDMTCRIYELETGFLLTTVRVDYAITAVSMDESEYFLFLGSAEGDIYRINLFSVKDAEIHYKKAEQQCAFLGHNKEITSLSVSSMGKYLASGSEDHDVRIWDTSNFSCVRKIPCAGPVTNVFITLCPPGLNMETRFNPRLLVNAFRRQYDQSENEMDYVTTRIQSKKLSLFHLGSPDEYFDSRILNSSTESLEALNRSNITVEDLSRINTQMYSYALCDTISTFQESSDSNVDSD